MDRKERKVDVEELFTSFFELMQSGIWTALPGVVQSYNAATQTAQVQCSMNVQYRDVNRKLQTMQIPLLPSCPIVWPGGGGVTLTFTPAKGDEGVIVFSSRCIDAWWKQGYTQPVNGQFSAANTPPEFRMHDLSDGFFIPGARNKKRAFVPIGSGAALQTDDGDAYVSINPTTHNVTGVANQFNLNGVTIDSSGNIVTAGNIQGATVTGTTQVVAKTGSSAVHLTTHEHPTAGTGAPSPPTPGT